MKKIIIYSLLVVNIFNSYSITFDKSIKDNNLLMKIGVIMVSGNFSLDSPYRYPFKEYYLFDNSKILAITPVLKKDMNGKFF